MGEYKIRFVKHESGIVSMLNSPALQGVLKSKAEVIKSTASAAATYRGATYVTDVQPGRGRAHARASTASEGAWWNEMRGGGPLRSSF